MKFNNEQTILKYCLMGFFIGLSFPILAIFVESFEHNLTIKEVIENKKDLLFFIICFAPFVLSFIFYFLGKSRLSLKNHYEKSIEIINNRYQEKALALDKTIMVAFTDPKGNINYVNELFCQTSGFDKNEIIGKNFKVLNSGLMDKKFFNEFWGSILKGNVWKGEMCNKNKHGYLYWVESLIIPQKNEKNEIIGFASFNQDISLRKKLEKEIEFNSKELIKSKNLAESALQAKALFLANISHEIRTPMNGMIGMCNLLSQTSLSKEQKKQVEIIEECGSFLLELVNDVLDFSKLEAGKFVYEEEDMDLKKIINDVVRLYETKASEKGIVLYQTVPENFPSFVIGDAHKIRQIISNLVSNAIKFTEKGTIEVKVNILSSENSLCHILFEVKDSGIGISSEAQEKLFKPFSQVDSSFTRKIGGTGLGLSICKGFIDHMGGKIWVESKPPSGSSFKFDLKFKLSNKTESTNLMNSNTIDSTMGNIKPLKILLVEDNKVNQMVFQGYLGKLGYQADTAANGIECLEGLKNQSYDVIFMDCHMPIMDGFETTKQIKQNYPNPPLICALTASALSEEKNKCFEVGMNNFLSKPLLLKDLMLFLEKTYKNKEKRY